LIGSRQGQQIHTDVAMQIVWDKTPLMHRCQKQTEAANDQATHQRHPSMFHIWNRTEIELGWWRKVVYKNNTLDTKMSEGLGID
jgi:hypothetical protein